MKIKGYLNYETKEITVINQIEAEKLGLSEYECEVAFNGRIYLKGYIPEKTQEEKENEVRNIRDNYLIKYVDYYQTRPLLWAELSFEMQEKIKSYRLYLLNYTDSNNWFENNPITFEEWEESGLFTPPPAPVPSITIQPVDSMPETPDSNTLYCIRE